jgi:hypothetical protein
MPMHPHVKSFTNTFKQIGLIFEPTSTPQFIDGFQIRLFMLTRVAIAISLQQREILQSLTLVLMAKYWNEN